MKKSQINAILVDQTKRRNTILAYSSFIFILFILALSFILLYFSQTKDYTVSYIENSDIDYKVYLKKNPYFNEAYLDEDSQYLEQLIDYIDANFKYNISLAQQDVDFKYSYHIDAKVEVKSENGKNPIYEFTDTLLEPIEVISKGDSKVAVNENLKIDYNHYNNLIKGFISAYSLSNVESTLTVNMYIDVIGSCEEFEEDANNQSVMSLVIPLTTKTVDIDITNDLTDTTDNVMLCKQNSSSAIIFLVLFILSGLLIAILFAFMVKYIIATRTAEDIYHKELARILNNYGTYIQEVVDGVDLEDYEVWKIKTFNDMMEISDKLNQPILMVENNRKTGVYFIIPYMDKRLYLYGFKVSEIKKEMKKNAEADK